MARIRTIKPEFPHSESIGRLTRNARLCFIMLWTIADDAGRLRGNSRALASLLFPYDDDAADLMEDWLGELISLEMIIRYCVNGSTYIQISKWLEHQKIDHPAKSKLPEFAKYSDALASVGENLALDLRTKDQGPKEGTMDRERVSPDGEAASRKEPSRATRLPSDWEPTAEERDYASELGLDPTRQAQDFREYWLAKGGSNARKVDWRLTWQTWCRRAVEFRNRGSPAQTQRFSAAAYAKSRRENAP